MNISTTYRKILYAWYCVVWQDNIYAMDLQSSVSYMICLVFDLEWNVYRYSVLFHDNVMHFGTMEKKSTVNVLKFRTL